ncbi:hypothetical protein [Pseudorhodoferax sp. Leaf265]|uniref:hypothetical protein n=1 Tax=Pseudorhodoferax sp. Leaf265 TaxID=1736315 RepID=UPI0012E701FC|nr:hypothetical protein [Pseudorhodoferax sp. Leaf265]
MRMFSVTELREFRSRAKAIRREGGMIHSHALDSIAREEGFADWQSLIHFSNAHPFEPDPLHYGALEFRGGAIRRGMVGRQGSALRRSTTVGRSTKSDFHSTAPSNERAREPENFEIDWPAPPVTTSDKSPSELHALYDKHATPIILVRKRTATAEQAQLPMRNSSPATHRPRSQLTLRGEQ